MLAPLVALLALTSAPPAACGPGRPGPGSLAPEASAARQLATERGPQNVLLILVDDIGIDRVAAYGEHPRPGRTPNIDRLAGEGMLFRNAWASPTCSPARATLLTGRYGFRTGIGVATGPGTRRRGLPLSETTLPELLRSASGDSISTACFGKWHLAGPDDDELHPLESGFEHFAGALYNLPNYFRWKKQTNAITTRERSYATVDTTDDAIAALAELPEPWFVLVSYHAAHEPLHIPPAELHTFELGPDCAERLFYEAALEAVDSEIGRLRGALGERAARTTTVFCADNGTPGKFTSAPFDPQHAKRTVYEGGVRVPLIVAGPGVDAGSECRALVGLVDLFATTTELFGIDARAELPARVALDSISLVPYLTAPESAALREYLYAERFYPNGPGPYRVHERAVRDARWKLVVREGALAQAAGLPTEELFDLLDDPFETSNLAAEEELSPGIRAARERLRTELERLAGTAEAADAVLDAPR